MREKNLHEGGTGFSRIKKREKMWKRFFKLLPLPSLLFLKIFRFDYFNKKNIL